MDACASFRQKVGILTETLVYISFVLSLQLLSFTNGQCWPNGTYGLPRPKSGCPEGYRFVWETGSSVFSGGVSNRVTVQHHLWGSLNNESTSLHFCMKLNSTPYCSNDSVSSSEWPSGCYCILKRGDCPESFRSGTIHWNESSITNGSVPDGAANASIFTNIEFCCRCDNSSAEPIVLPTDRAFYLMALYPQCQLVFGMEARLEYVIWYSSQNESNYIQRWTPAYYDFNRDIVTLFCYYAPSNASTTVGATSPLTSVTNRMPTTLLQLETTKVTDETMTSEIIMATLSNELAPSQMNIQATTLSISGDTPGPSPMTSQATTSSISEDTNQFTSTTGVVSSSMLPSDTRNPMSHELEREKVIGISIAGGFLGGIVVVLFLLLCCVPICFKVRRKKKNEYYVTSSKNSMWVTSTNTPGVGTLLNGGYAIPMSKNPGYTDHSALWSRERSNEVKFNYF